MPKIPITTVDYEDDFLRQRSELDPLDNEDLNRFVNRTITGHVHGLQRHCRAIDHDVLHGIILHTMQGRLHVVLGLKGQHVNFMNVHVHDDETYTPLEPDDAIDLEVLNGFDPEPEPIEHMPLKDLDVPNMKKDDT